MPTLKQRTPSTLDRPSIGTPSSLDKMPQASIVPDRPKREKGFIERMKEGLSSDSSKQQKAKANQSLQEKHYI